MDLHFFNGHNTIFTCVGGLIKYCRLIFYFVGKGAVSASIANLSFDNVVRFFGVPVEMIIDRYLRFTSFW